MRQDRAAEIISSSLQFEVTWNGRPVWIESVDKTRGMAQIVIMGSRDKKEVPVQELTETGNFESLLD